MESATVSKKYVPTRPYLLGIMKRFPSNSEVTVHYCSILQLNVEHKGNN
jgi:hypothetical protein